MTGSQVYRNPPLALALLEMRHPEVEPLGRGELAGLKQQLIRYTPLQKAEEITELEMKTGPGFTPRGTSRVRTIQRFLSRDRRTAISYALDSLSVETTAYRGWESFRGIVRASVEARQDVAPVDGFERIGLRYIDEIRVPNDGSELDWGLWVAGSLLAPSVPEGQFPLRALQQQATVQYATDRPAETLTLRYGAVDGPPVVTGGPNLVRPDVPNKGPFFLIDTDAAWTLRPGDAVPEVNPDAVLAIADRLHAPIKGLFETLITDRLRREVLDAD